jgi:hypothetical protein
VEIEQLRRANDDPEFQIAARFWNTVLHVGVDDTGEPGHLIRIRDGRIEEIRPQASAGPGEPWQLSISASRDDWRRFLEPVPRPFYQDLWGASIYHGFRIQGDLEAHLYPYYPAVRRMFELLRPAS